MEWSAQFLHKWLSQECWNWYSQLVSKIFVDFLAFPICIILNSSFKEQCLPTLWKIADVNPLPKNKVICNLVKIYDQFH